MTTQEIQTASATLSAARLEAEEAATALASVTEAVSEVQAKITDLTGERDRIVIDRKGGKVSPKQGPRLAEIDADLEGLREILVERQSASTTAAGEAQRLNQAVTAAAWVLSTTTDGALLAGLKEIASDLDQRLLATLDGIAVVATRLGHSRSAWRPSPTLATAIRRLELEGQAR